MATNLNEVFNILTPETEGGSELTTTDRSNIQVVVENLADLLLVAESLKGGTSIVSIDGNDTRIQVRRKALSEWSATEVPAAGEICVILSDLDAVFQDMKVGDGGSQFGLLPSIRATFSTADLENALAGATAARTATEAARDEALAATNEIDTSIETAINATTQAVIDANAAAAASEQWANASSDVEIEPGARSARGWADIAASRAEQVAKFPIRFLDNQPGNIYTLQRGDLFRILVYRGANNLTVTLPQNLSTEVAFDGSTGAGVIKLVRLASAGTVTLAGATTGTTVTPPTITGRYNNFEVQTTDIAPAHSYVPAAITIPAGTKRKLWVAGFELNADPANHVVNLSVSVGTVTKVVADTSPTGEDVADSAGSPSPVNSMAWVVALPDSDTPTALTLTFAIPAKNVSFAWYAESANAAETVSAQGDSTVTASTTMAASIANSANSVVAAAFGSQNGNNGSLTVTGATARTSFRTGTRGFKDFRVWGVDTDVLVAAGNLNITTTWQIPEPWGYQAAVFNPAPASGASPIATIGSVLSVPSGGYLNIYPFSDGNTYLVEA